MPIYFYSKTVDYFEFSNFSPHGVEIGGAYWPTVEHFFQAQKFEDEAYRERIRRAQSPKDAKQLGRTRSLPILSDWNTRRDEVMLEAIRQKFSTHRQVRELLLSTGDEELIENAPSDFYWGCGRTGTGQNKLGKILMQVREELRGASQSEVTSEGLLVTATEVKVGQASVPALTRSGKNVNSDEQTSFCRSASTQARRPASTFTSNSLF